MKMKKLDINAFVAEERFKEECYTHVLLYYFDRVIFESTSKLKSITFDHLIQGWIFGPQKQVHIFQGKLGLIANTKSSDDGHLFLKEEHLLDARFKHLGKALLINKYLVEDEDGQVFVSHQELAGVVGATYEK